MNKYAVNFFFRKMESQLSPKAIKIILVGNTGVGKTCLIGSYLKQHFDENTQATLSPAYSTQQITKSDGTKITIQIWDTAGQEKYQAVSQLFFRNSDIAILCFTAGDRESMTSIHEWISMVCSESPKCKLIFVATKSDLLQKKDFENVIHDAEAEFQQYQSPIILLTSAKTSYNIDNVFRIAGEIAESISTVAPNGMDLQRTEKSSCC